MQGHQISTSICLIVLALFPVGIFSAQQPQGSCSALLNKGSELLSHRQVNQAIITLEEAQPRCGGTSQFYATLGLAYDLSSQHQRAREAYRKAIALDPNVPGLYDNLGISYFSTGNFAAGIAEFKKAIEIDPHDVAAGINLGRYYLRDKNYQSAIRHFLAAGVLQSRDPVSLFQLAQACFGARDLNRAHQAVGRLSGIAGSNARIRFSLGLLLARNREYEMAAREFKAIPPSASDFAVYLNLGMVYSKLGRFEQARQAYENALQIDPASPEPYLRLGIDAAKARRNAQAVDWLSQAYAKAPGKEDISYVFAEELIQNRSYTWAESVLSHAMKLHPDAAGLVEAQGDLYLAQQKNGQAADSYLRCLNMNPHLVSARVSLAKSYLASGQSEKAREQLEAVLLAQPGNAEANALLGSMELKSGKEEAALHMTEEALKRDPDNRTANENLAEISIREGKYPQAYAALEKLAKLEPKSSRVHFLLGRVLLKLGRQNDAEHEFELSRTLQAAPPARSGPMAPAGR